MKQNIIIFFFFLNLVIITLYPKGFAIELTSSPTTIRSLNNTGFTRWQNPEDARCESSRSSASECYARTYTEILEAQGFVFDLPHVRWLEARWDIDIEPVPVDGWILHTLQLQWDDNVLNLSSPNHSSHDKSVSLRIRAVGDIDWRNISLRVAFESTNEDAIFLVTCIELKAKSDWEPPVPEPPKLVHYEFGLAVMILFCILIIAFHQGRFFRYKLYRNAEDARSELVDIESSTSSTTLLYRTDVAFRGLNIVKSDNDDPFIKKILKCVYGEDQAFEAYAHELRIDDDTLDRFSRLRRIHHVNLVDFLGIYKENHTPKGTFVIWASYKEPLNNYRNRVDPCADLGLRISQAASCGLACLHRHLYMHGDVSCRNLVINNEDRITLIGAGHVTSHNVSSYIDRNAPKTDPLRWMAPEAIKNNVLDLSTDTWSMGVLIWEACSALDAIPFEMSSKHSSQQDFIDDQVDQLPKPIQQPEYAIKSVWAIAETCLKKSRDSRPSMIHVRDALLAESDIAGVSSSSSRSSILMAYDGEHFPLL